MKKIIFLIGILISVNSFAQAPFKIRNKEIDLLYVNDSMSIRLGTNYVEHRTDKKGFDFGQSVHLDTLFYEYLNPPVVGSTITFEYSYDRITWGAYSYGKRYFRTSDDGGSTWQDTVLFFSGNTPAQVTLFEYGDEPYSAYDPRWGGQTAVSAWMHFSLNNGGTWSDPIPITQTATNNLYQYSDDTISWTYTYALQKWMHFGTDSVNWSQPILLRDDGAIGSIVVKYSRDSALYWRNTYNDSTLYIKLSVDGGISYSNAIQINDTDSSIGTNYWTLSGGYLSPTTSTNRLSTLNGFWYDKTRILRVDTVNSNISIGDSALKKLTLNSIVAIGTRAMGRNTQGSGSVAIGYQAFVNGKSGLNVAIGYNALAGDKINALGCNVAIGAGSLQQNQGHYCSAVGFESLINNTSYLNNAYGYRTLYNNINGNYNTSIGNNGLYSNISGSKNISLGSYSGYYNTTESNRLYINSTDRGTINGDTTLSIIYGHQSTSTSLQKLKLNAKTYVADTLLVTSGLNIDNRTNGVQIDTTYGIKLNGTATVFEDLRIDGISLGTGADAPAMTGSYANNEYFSQRMFQGSAQDDKAYFNVQLPHSWKEGGEFEMHIHTSPWTEPSAGDTVVWELHYMWENINGTFDSITTVTVKQPMNGIPQWGHKLQELVEFNTAGKTISSVLVCSLYRLAQSSSSDTYSGGVTVLYVDCHYERDGIGSKKELIK